MSKLSRYILAFAGPLISAGLAAPAHAGFKAEVKYAKVGEIKMATTRAGRATR